MVWYTLRPRYCPGYARRIEPPPPPLAMDPALLSSNQTMPHFTATDAVPSNMELRFEPAPPRPVQVAAAQIMSSSCLRSFQPDRRRAQLAEQAEHRTGCCNSARCEVCNGTPFEPWKGDSGLKLQKQSGSCRTRSKLQGRSVSQPQEEVGPLAVGVGTGREDTG